LRVALEMSWLMGNNPIQRLQEASTFAKSDEVLERYLADRLPKVDANDYLYAFEASHDYDPGPGLEKIKAPLLAINFADDLINPPELGVLEREIKRVKRGKAILVPLSEETRGHGTHTLVPVWKKHLAKFLKQTETRANRLQTSSSSSFSSSSSVLVEASRTRTINTLSVSDARFERPAPPRRRLIMDNSPAYSRLTDAVQTEQSLPVGLLADVFPTSPKTQHERFP
jgi:hypothetical protein